MNPQRAGAKSDILVVARLLAEQRGFEPPEGLKSVAGSGWASALRDAHQIVTALNDARQPAR